MWTPEDDRKYYVTYAVQEIQNGVERWTAFHPELQGCNATAATAEDAIEKLEDARENWLKTARELEYDIPEPQLDNPRYFYEYDPRGAIGKTRERDTSSEAGPSQLPAATVAK